MSILIPGNVPQMHPSAVRLTLQRALEREPGLLGLDVLRAVCPVMVLAVRGYYRDSMGVPGQNDVGIFDDAAFVVSGGNVTPFNWNCDPSKVGFNAAVGKPFAMLKPGLWPFVRGQHKGRGAAWRQPDSGQAKNAGLSRFFSDSRSCGEFKVWRDRDGLITADSPVEDDYQAINIHWGGEFGTSSWGCQTAPPVQWPAFQKLSYKLAGQQPFLPYMLIGIGDCVEE